MGEGEILRRPSDLLSALSLSPSVPGQSRSFPSLSSSIPLPHISAVRSNVTDVGSGTGGAPIADTGNASSSAIREGVDRRCLSRNPIRNVRPPWLDVVRARFWLIPGRSRELAMGHIPL